MATLNEFDNPVLSTKRAAMHDISSSISKVNSTKSNKWRDIKTVYSESDCLCLRVICFT